MTNSELFSEGVNLMISGMGFVMFFLFTLIYAIALMPKLIIQYFLELVPAPISKPKVATPPVQDDLERLSPAIVAATAHHRSKEGS